MLTSEMWTNFRNLFTVKFTGCAEKEGIKTTTSPQICCRTTLRNVRGQLYSFTFLYIISKHNMLHVIGHLFHEFLFICLFIFLPNTDVIMTLLQYFVCCILIPFSYEDERFAHH